MGDGVGLVKGRLWPGLYSVEACRYPDGAFWVLPDP